MTIISRLVSLVSRRTLRAEGHVFAVTPERVAMAEGVRAALAMAPMLAAAAVLHQPEFVFGAVAAFWNCLCDPQGSKTGRLKTMAAFTALGAIAMPLAAYIAHFGYAVSLATLFVLVFLCGLTRTYKPSLGPMPAQAGLIASAAVVIGIASARPFGGALELAGYFLLGSVWTMLFCIFLWPIPGRHAASLTVATIFGRLESMAGFLESLDRGQGMDAPGWTEFDTVYRGGVRMSIERGRALAAHDVCNGSQLRPTIDAANRVFSALIAIGHSRRDRPAEVDDGSQRMLEDLRRLLQSIAAQAQQGLPISDVQTAQARVLLSEAATRKDQAARGVVFATKAIIRVGDHNHTSIIDPGPSPNATGGARYKIDALVWRHSLRVAVAGVVAYGFGTWLNVTSAYWGALAAIIVTQPISTNTWLRVLERACGSLVGGVIAAALLTNLSEPAAMALAILPLAAVSIALRLVNYGLFVVFLTPMFMLASEFIHPAHGLIFARFANEVVGACLGVAASFLLWPERQNNALVATLSAAISSNMKFASAVVRMDTSSVAALDLLQREAGLASFRLETARQRMALEGRSRSARLDRLLDLIRALRSVCGAAAVIQVLGEGQADAHGRQRADHYDAMTVELLQVLASPGTSLPIRSTEMPADDLTLAIQRFVIAFEGYVAKAPETPTQSAA
jgi:uncharacterized membrane protein YgaE (UPF0421/DUF939 family)